MSAWHSHIPAVDIDAEGVFKYVLLRVESGDKATLVVRGHEWAPFHDDIVQAHKQQLRGGAGGEALHVSCVGGGRIRHEPGTKTLFVYGYSQGYGRADHAASVALLKAAYPDYSVTWSNEGY